MQINLLWYDEKVTGFSFATDNDEYDKWSQAIPNTTNNGTKFVSVCEKH